jgi:hypothetical protein
MSEHEIRAVLMGSGAGIVIGTGITMIITGISSIRLVGFGVLGLGLFMIGSLLAQRGKP